MIMALHNVAATSTDIQGSDISLRGNMWRRAIAATRLIGLLVLCFNVSGCAVYMAANQPDKKDLGVFKAGTARATVIAELGAPVQTVTRDGAKVDLYTFTQGYSGVEKGGRAVLHGAADVLTLGLWEVVGTPIEGVANGTKITVEITYDKEDRVSKVVPIRGQDAIASGQ